MKANMVTTNLRLPKEDLIQYKILAAELDISFNEFVQRVLRQVEVMDREKLKQELTQSYQDDSFWKLGKIMTKSDITHAYDLSEEDKIIYGITD
jgi:hypothetical protein